MRLFTERRKDVKRKTLSSEYLASHKPLETPSENPNVIFKNPPGENIKTGAIWAGGAFSATPPYALLSV